MKAGAGPISAVIPHWNRRDLLAGLLPMLDDQTALLREYIVVDNGSTDGSAEEAIRLGAHVIHLETNVGFSRAVNLGIAAAETEWIAVLNNDVLLDQDYLELLHRFCLESGARFASGKLYAYGTDKKILDGTWDLVSRAACGWRVGQGKPDGPDWNKTRKVHLIPFTAVLVHRPTFLELGGLDEAYGSYLEDLDFCFRAALKGLEAGHVPNACGVHLGSATLGTWSSAMVRAISRNQILFVCKFYPLDLRRKLRRATVAGQLLWGLLALRHGALVPWVLGRLDGWRASRRIQGRSSEIPVEKLELLLCDSEREIFAIQQKCGFDWYWRAYFRWCGN